MTRKSWSFSSTAPALCGVLLCVGSAASAASATPVPPNTMRVHYHRNDNTYTGWGVYSWAGPATPQTAGFPVPNCPFSQSDPDGWGNYVDIPMDPAATGMSFLLVTPANGGTKDSPNNLQATFSSLAAKGGDTWVIAGDSTAYSSEPTIQRMALANAQAIWISPDTLVWPGSTGAAFKLLLAPSGGIGSNAAGVTGASQSYNLTTAASISPKLQAEFPQFAGCQALTLPANVLTHAALTGQIVVVSMDAKGSILEGTSVQLAPVLDAFYAKAATSKAIGLSFSGNVPTFALWAPTAKSVSINIYPNSTSNKATSYPMIYDPASGVWWLTARNDAWTNKAYYDFKVTVFSRSANNAIVTNTVTDPYSISLNANSQHSMVLNLKDPATAPAGWPGKLIATSATPTDSVIYELHIRDFSAFNGNGNAGKYLAFTENSAGMTHLADLASAGLTHIHLLPAFDSSSVDELAAVNPQVPATTGAGLKAASFLATPNASGISPQDNDSYNWGYDPWHFGAPEGSYSSDPSNGAVRVREFRQMVQALHDKGLRVIMDVVYNHTTAAGQSDRSVLDRIVPGYYYRLDSLGQVEADSCCSDTAPEFAMMEKLMTDTLVQWASQYKVDGFRFDIMGFIPKAVMVRAQAAVNAVAAADGRGHTYFYGEGWSFGHLLNTPIFTPATQANMAGTGIGTFNDRLRDAVRGGVPFDTGAAVVANQGFNSGLFYDNNDGTQGTIAQKVNSLANQNNMSICLAGNLAAFPLNGSTLGKDLEYGDGIPTGYTTSPQENVPYISVHDNETIWDISQYKHPAGTSGPDRGRAQVVGLSTVLLSNGVPFIHAGDDLLRSKSEDSNSVNSGDYFNRIFWDGSRNNWAVGAPPQNTGNNVVNLSQEQTVLANANAAVGSTTILAASAAFQDFLRVRKDSSMFHLATAAEIVANVRFPDQGLGQLPGVIAMQVGDGTTPCGDNKYGSAMIVFNATKTPQTITYPWYKGRNVALHPAQKNGSDSVVKTATFNPATGGFQVPARTTAVFVEGKTNTFTCNYPEMYLRGEMNGWTTDDPMQRVGPHLWQISLQLAPHADGTPKTAGFKFDTGTWATAFGDSGKNDGKASQKGGNLSLTATVPGSYVITFNDSSLAYAVLPPVWFPGTPANLSAKAASATAILLSWKNAGGATQYNIFRSPDGNAPYVKVATASTADPVYKDSDLTTGATYFYKISAANALFVSPLTSSVSAVPMAGGGGKASSPFSSMFMNGNWNTWATLSEAGKMVLTANNTWSVALKDLSAGDIQFKFDTDDNWGNTPGAKCWATADATKTGLTGKASLTGSSNITVTLPSDGNYTFTFNDLTLAYTCSKN